MRIIHFDKPPLEEFSIEFHLEEEILVPLSRGKEVYRTSLRALEDRDIPVCRRACFMGARPHRAISYFRWDQDDLSLDGSVQRFGRNSAIIRFVGSGKLRDGSSTQIPDSLSCISYIISTLHL